MGVGGLALLILMTLAIPLFSMRLAFTDAGNDPTSLTTRQAYDLLATGFGPGFNGPLVVASPLSSTGRHRHHQQGGCRIAIDSRHRLRRTGRGQCRPQRRSDHRLSDLVSTGRPDRPTGHQLRTTVIPAVTAGTGLRVLVGGETAGSVDASTYLAHRLYWVIGAVVVLAFLLLMAVFRSVVIPVKAAVMNLLSVGAAYGVIVAVFQWGWGGSIIGIGQTGPIDPWIPLMMFTILFGLSMDYEVFLLSRIREEWRKHRGQLTSRWPTAWPRPARVITAAAAIMICVFGSFVIGDPLRVLKVFGLGLAVSIFIDASLVRLVLVPSVMELLGRANWYIPGWLDRIVPTLGVEVDVDLPEHPVDEEDDAGTDQKPFASVAAQMPD